MPTVKANLSKTDYTAWLIVKAIIGNGSEINNDEALNRLVAHYNREKGRKII